MIRTVAALLVEPVSLFEYAVANEVFGLDRTDDGMPAFEFRSCAVTPEVPLNIIGGGKVIASHGLDGLRDADLVIIPAGGHGARSPQEQAAAIEALCAAAARGATLLSVCSGVFLLAATGLLDGKTAATHWMMADRLAAAHPTINVDREVLFCDQGSIITSAGTAAGIDACLHLVRREFGADVANAIARRMVVPPHREGGQRQFIALPVPPAPAAGFGELLDHVRANLETEFTVPALAARVHMSPRTFARRFVDEVGLTPHRWIIAQRVARARDLLETTEADVETVARISGFGSAALLRQHFTSAAGIPPLAYRRQFSYATTSVGP